MLAVWAILTAEILQVPEYERYKSPKHSEHLKYSTASKPEILEVQGVFIVSSLDIMRARKCPQCRNPKYCECTKYLHLFFQNTVL